LDVVKTKEQLLNELIRMQKDIEKKVEAQERCINRFQLLAQNDGLFSQVIDNLPYPVAIFERSGVVRMANDTLIRQAKIRANDISEGKINLLNRVTDENYTVFEAAEDVFIGETTMLKNLVFPLALFHRDEAHKEQDAYQNAVFFPVPGSDGIKYGAVMLMK